ncbi:MAG: hypothetical protein LBB58_01720, partial [Cellulomonadaceae bacterium]|nr:hypothetical protein [Cellulomonadaceae bacterium]
MLRNMRQPAVGPRFGWFVGRFGIGKTVFWQDKVLARKGSCKHKFGQHNRATDGGVAMAEDWAAQRTVAAQVQAERLHARKNAEHV